MHWFSVRVLISSLSRLVFGTRFYRGYPSDRTYLYGRKYKDRWGYTSILDTTTILMFPSKVTQLRV